MAASNYLHKRPHSQHWQVRWMVPKAARPIIGKAEFTKSLRVTDHAEAKRLARIQVSLWEQEVLGRCGNPSSETVSLREATERELASYAATTYYQEQRTLGREFAKLSVRQGAKSLAEHRTQSRELVEHLNERAFVAENRDLSYAEYRLRELGLSIPSDEGVRARFGELLQSALIDAKSGVLADMERREYTPSPTIQEVHKRDGQKAKAGERITELFERYAAQRLAEKRKRADTVNQDRKVVAQFATFVGADRSVASITTVEVREWRDTVSAVPPSFRKLKANEGLTLVEAAAKAKSHGLKRVAPATINKYLSTVSPFLKWCRGNSYLEHDPCGGLFYDLQKLKRRRPPFSTAQLNSLLQSPLFVGFEQDGKEFKPGNEKADDWRFWVPLVCMFTGARIGEVAQLRLRTH